MKTHLHIDPLGGVAGDMLLAALFDIGLDFETWKTTLEKLPIEKSQIELSQVQRGAFSAKHLSIRPFEENAINTGKHNHDHSHLGIAILLHRLPEGFLILDLLQRKLSIMMGWIGIFLISLATSPILTTRQSSDFCFSVNFNFL